MKKKNCVLNAIDRGYLVIDSASNSIAWSNNTNVPLAVAALGTDPVDVLVNKLSTDEGALLYNALVDLVMPESTIMTSLTIPSKSELEGMKASKMVIEEPVSLVTESDAELLDIMEQGIDAGLITFKLPMYHYYQGEPFKKKEGFVEGLRKNPKMLKNLLYEIGKTKKIATA